MDVEGGLLWCNYSIIIFHSIEHQRARHSLLQQKRHFSSLTFKSLCEPADEWLTPQLQAFPIMLPLIRCDLAPYAAMTTLMPCVVPFNREGGGGGWIGGVHNGFEITLTVNYEIAKIKEGRRLFIMFLIWE